MQNIDLRPFLNATARRVLLDARARHTLMMLERDHGDSLTRTREAIMSKYMVAGVLMEDGRPHQEDVRRLGVALNNLVGLEVILAALEWGPMWSPLKDDGTLPRTTVSAYEPGATPERLEAATQEAIADGIIVVPARAVIVLTVFLDRSTPLPGLYAPLFSDGAGERPLEPGLTPLEEMAEELWPLPPGPGGMFDAKLLTPGSRWRRWDGLHVEIIGRVREAGPAVRMHGGCDRFRSDELEVCFVERVREHELTEEEFRAYLTTIDVRGAGPAVAADGLGFARPRCIETLPEGQLCRMPEWMFLDGRFQLLGTIRFMPSRTHEADEPGHVEIAPGTFKPLQRCPTCGGFGTLEPNKVGEERGPPCPTCNKEPRGLYWNPFEVIEKLKREVAEAYNANYSKASPERTSPGRAIACALGKLLPEHAGHLIEILRIDPVEFLCETCSTPSGGIHRWDKLEFSKRAIFSVEAAVFAKACEHTPIIGLRYALARPEQNLRTWAIRCALAVLLPGHARHSFTVQDLGPPLRFSCDTCGGPRALSVPEPEFIQVCEYRPEEGETFEIPEGGPWAREPENRAAR